MDSCPIGLPDADAGFGDIVRTPESGPANTVFAVNTSLEVKSAAGLCDVHSYVEDDQGTVMDSGTTVIEGPDRSGGTKRRGSRYVFVVRSSTRQARPSGRLPHRPGPGLVRDLSRGRHFF